MQQRLSLIQFCLLFAKHEWQVTWRAGQHCWLAAAFLVVILCLWPLALPADPQLLHQIAPGLFWIGLMCAIILVLDKLFLADFVDHGVIHWLMSPYPLVSIVLVRLLMTSLFFIIACVGILPLFAILYQLSMATVVHLCLTLLLAIPSLIAIGGAISALLIGVGQRSILLPILIVPLWLPVLIFGTTSMLQHMQGLPTMGQFAMLGACFLITLTTAPIAIAAALRTSLE